MAKKKGKKPIRWYLLAYDIRQEKRLRRLHYFIKKQGIALQRSVFLLRVDSAGLEEVLEEIRLRVSEQEDDVRIYPIHSPGSLWAAGQQNNRLQGLYGPAPKQPSSRLGSFFNRLFSGKKK